jgi:hypothetical protein
MRLDRGIAHDLHLLRDMAFFYGGVLCDNHRAAKIVMGPPEGQDTGANHTHSSKVCSLHGRRPHVQ